MNDYLQKIAYEVLYRQKDGVSKVRFAKILYFVHKGLILNKSISANEMKFIRMPLGPVPSGFKHLNKDPNIETYISATSALLYDSQVYKLNNPSFRSSSKYGDEIKKILSLLENLPTSQLVAISHDEPSWKKYKNGDEYFIEQEDLDVPLPRVKANKLTKEIEEQKLQGHLMNGMIEDIVDESTSLEYLKQ